METSQSIAMLGHGSGLKGREYSRDGDTRPRDRVYARACNKQTFANRAHPPETGAGNHIGSVCDAPANPDRPRHNPFCSQSRSCSRSTTAASSSNPTSQDAGFDGAAFPPGLRAYDLTLVNQRGRKRVAERVSRKGGRARVPVCRLQDVRARRPTGARSARRTGEYARRGAVREHRPGGRYAARASLDSSDETSLSGRVEYLTGTSEQLRPVWRAYGVAPVSAGRTALRSCRRRCC